MLGFIISKEGKTPDPKKIEALVQMLEPTLGDSSVQWNGTVLQMFY